MVTKKEDVDIPTTNLFEEALQFNNNSSDINELLAQIILNGQNLKSEALNKFIANEAQKTEINYSERTILPLCELLAKNPFFDICENIKKTNGKPLTELEETQFKKQFEVDFLSEFLNRFMILGIPLKRKGRNEEVEILKSYLHEEDLQLKTTGQNSNFR